MAITEAKVISQVTILPTANTINVQWANQINKENVVIAETFERKAYAQDQKDEFLAEVENASAYIDAIGW